MAFPGRPTISNVTLTTANTEYSYTVPEYTFKLQIKARSTTAAIKVAYVSGESGTNYFTIPAGQTYWEDNITVAFTIYMQSTTAGTVAEVLTWQGK